MGRSQASYESSPGQITMNEAQVVSGEAGGSVANPGNVPGTQAQAELDFSGARFNGSDYEPGYDDNRLRGQIARIYKLMQDRRWRTLSEIEEATNDPQASISAQLRHLRKKRFGSHLINKRSRGEREQGLFEYQLEV